MDSSTTLSQIFNFSIRGTDPTRNSWRDSENLFLFTDATFGSESTLLTSSGAQASCFTNQDAIPRTNRAAVLGLR